MTDPTDTTNPTDEGQAPDPTLIGGDADAAAGDGDAAAGSDKDVKGEADGGDKADDKSGDEDKSKDDKPSIIGAPEAYEFKMPEGVTLDTEALAVVEPVLREMDLSQEAAAKLVSTYAEKVMPLIEKRANEANEAAGAALRAQWANETLADKELGGAKLEESKAYAAKAMAKFLPQKEEGQAFRTFLNESGLGNHPEFVRFTARIGRALGEASADLSEGAASNPAPTEQRWYGNSQTK